MGSPTRGHMFGHRFFDDTMADGFVLFDEDRGLHATRATWSALVHSGTAAAVSDWCRSEMGEGLHEIPQRFFAPFEVHPVAEQVEGARLEAGRLPGFNTVVCPECGQGETRLRRWFNGQRSVWWCDPCHRPVPTLRLVG